MYRKEKGRGKKRNELFSLFHRVRRGSTAKQKKMLQIFINAHYTFFTSASDAKMGRLIVI